MLCHTLEVVGIIGGESLPTRVCEFHDIEGDIGTAVQRELHAVTNLAYVARLAQVDPSQLNVFRKTKRGLGVESLGRVASALGLRLVRESA